jgi:DNA modification methylase
LAQEFIEFFTRRGQNVLDPMVGTGSTLVAALRAGRASYGIEISPTYADLSRQVVSAERVALSIELQGLPAEVITGNAFHIARYVDLYQIPVIDYVYTSPPYWNMLHAKGYETQKKRRSTPGLDTVYSNDPDDLGNIEDYEKFVVRLSEVYCALRPYLRDGAYLTIIVKNVKKGGKIYPLAWDLARQLSQFYSLKDERIWCQDNQRLSPYGIGKAWVSNTFHHYCLQFRNE